MPVVVCLGNAVRDFVFSMLENEIALLAELHFLRMLERAHVELDLIPPGLDGGIRRVAPHGGPRIGHRHAELEFNLVVAGRGAYVLHDRRYELRPGTLVWLFPWQDHVLLRSAGLELWVVVARADLLDTSVAPDSDLACRMLAGGDALGLERLLAQVTKETDEPAVFNAGLAYATRRAWRMSRAGAALTRYPMHPAVAKALLLLNRDEAPASLAALADACGERKAVRRRTKTASTR